MKIYQKIIFPFFLLILSLTAFAQNSPNVKENSAYRLSEQEQILFNLINDLRQQNKLSVLPISEKLCIVGYTHVNDLITNYKPDEGCSLHSWSDKGNWAPCCHSKDPTGIACMKTKPKEITGYTGLGFELIYWGNEDANALDAYNLWRENKASLEMILCTGKWKSFNWKTVGVSISSNYAILWFGDQIEKSAQTPVKIEKPEPIAQKEIKKEKEKPAETIVALTEEKPVKEDITTKSNDKYFLIVASLKTKEAAKSTLKKYKADGYSKAQIIEGNNMQRIAIKSFSKESEAQNELNKLRNKHPGIWLLTK